MVFYGIMIIHHVLDFHVHTTNHISTMKPFLSGHSKIDKTKILKTSGSLVQVKSIAECSGGAFCNTFDLH